VIAGVMAAVPDSRWDVSDVLADRDRVAIWITWSGTYLRAHFRGWTIPAPAKFAVEHVHIYRVAADRLAEHWVVRDDLAMLRQLGVAAR
jgi:predicted ester cyclase